MIKDQNKNQLPKDWNVGTFADLLDYIQPTKYIVESTEYDDSYKTPVLTAGKSFIKGYTNETHGIFNSLPVIIFDDFTTATKFVNFPFKVKSSAMKILAPKTSSSNIKFAFYLMQTVRISFDTHKRYWISVYSKTKIPLPSPKIQQAIVSKIEELFSELDKGIENLRTAQQQLKTYRQSVLKWAFVNDSFKNFLLKDITEKIQIGPFGTQLHKEDYIENGIPLINPTHIKDGFIVSDNSFTILKSKRDSLPNYILKEGDVIMGRRGEMGRCGLVTKKEVGWFCGTGSLYFRPDKKKVNPLFLYYNLRSEPVKKYLDYNAGGTTMANLNLKIVNEIPISLPSIEEQNNIVQEIESRLSVADKMEESITQSLQQAEALRQSILKKAFEGKLI